MIFMSPPQRSLFVKLKKKFEHWFQSTNIISIQGKNKRIQMAISITLIKFVVTIDHL